MVVIDAFLANDEIKIAEFRIDYLSDIVDITVIAESSLSHSGKRKPLHFNEWYFGGAQKSLKDRVKIIQIDLSPYKDSWEREIASREILCKHIYDNYPNSHFILSDLDEIPSIEQVKTACDSVQVYHFISPTVYLHANWYLKDGHRNWNRGLIGHTSNSSGPNGGRFVKWPVIDSHPGIHLSWLLGNSSSVDNKFSSTAHTELSGTQIMNNSLVAFARDFAVDHLGRFNEEGFGLLSIKDSKTFSDIEKHLFLKEPSFFNFNPKYNSTLLRFIASAICTIYWREVRYRGTISNAFISRSFSISSLTVSIFLVSRQIFVGMLYWSRRHIRKFISLLFPSL